MNPRQERARNETIQRIGDAVSADMDATEESEWKMLLARIPVLAQQSEDELTRARLMFSQGFLAGVGFGFALAAKARPREFSENVGEVPAC